MCHTLALHCPEIGGNSKQHRSPPQRVAAHRGAPRVCGLGLERRRVGCGVLHGTEDHGLVLGTEGTVTPLQLGVVGWS